MEQLAAFPEESWQQVVCHICKHRFAIEGVDAQGDTMILCQACTLLVEWFGQDEAEPPPVPSLVVSDEPPPKRVSKKQKQESQRVELGSLLERWGDLWQGSEEQA